MKEYSKIPVIYHIKSALQSAYLQVYELMFKENITFKTLIKYIILFWILSLSVATVVLVLDIFIDFNLESVVMVIGSIIIIYILVATFRWLTLRKS